jgi:hypothetical protein
LISKNESQYFSQSFILFSNALLQPIVAALFYLLVLWCLLLKHVWNILVFAFFVGCTRRELQPTTSPTALMMLGPFQGGWRLDLDKTVAEWKRQGMKDDDIEKSLEVAKKINEPVHSDLRIEKNFILLIGGHVKNRRYELFEMQQIDNKVCCKAWYHEDPIADPGDTHKCYIRLERKDDAILLSARHYEDITDLSDRDLTKRREVASKLAKYEGDDLPNDKWTEWDYYWFVKK